MGWLSSLFNMDKDRRLAKGQVFTSTHDAFSLPTSSPVFNSHPDAFNPDSLSTPDPDTARSPTSFSYPPQGSVAYGYVPSSAGFSSRPLSSSILPTHMDHLHTPYQAYPPLGKTWNRLRNWLNREYPELGDTLNYGILPQDLAQVELQFGFALPSVVRESYMCVDGQEAESAAGCSEGLFFGLTLLPLESVLEEWRFWRAVDDDPTTGANPTLRQDMQSIPPNWVRTEYSQRGWIPLIADKAGNYVGVDLNPAESGTVGQVIVFGRDFDTKVVLWNGDGPTGWAKWLASFVEELESGDGFEIGASDADEGSEDDHGYESYFYDGNGRGQGDGGGDTGSGGGLRYTGEYRGWNVLEAWADRSLRKWHESGVITDADLLPPEDDDKAKQKQPADVDIVDISNQGNATEIPIPILNSSHEEIPSPNFSAFAQHRSQQSQSLSPSSAATAGPSSSKSQANNLPTIAITRPPAPLPVGLPTARDIAPLPSPPHSGNTSLDEDLEAGLSNGITGMREVAEDIGLVTATRRVGKSKSPIRRDTSDSSASALPPTPPPSDEQIPSRTSPAEKASSSTNPSPSPAPPTPLVIPDLLADSATAELGTKILEPSPSSALTVKADSLGMQHVFGSTPVAAEPKVDGVAELEEETPPAEVDTTIRLIGGGGMSGISSSPAEEAPPQPLPTPPQPDSAGAVTAATPSSGSGADSDVASDADASAADKKKHKKSKSSLASLKRFSQQLGGKKRNTSSSSVKEVVSPSV